MKQILITLSVVLLQFSSAGVKGQAQEAAQLILNYEKLKQLEEILDNMYKGYAILSNGYNRIKNIAEGNYNLHQVFLDALFMINPSVRKYKRIPQIISYQELLLKHPDWINRFPQMQIASYLGMKPETLSRVRARLA